MVNNENFLNTYSGGLDNWVFSRLSEPFAADEIHWRVGGGGTILAYIDARQVVERLNYVVGSENWFDQYEPISFVNTEVRDVTDLEGLRDRLEEKGVNTKNIFWFNKGGYITGLKQKSYADYEYNDLNFGGVRCSLNVLGVVKQDVGTVSIADQIKGAHSDALKRAAVKFGIGTYLYDLKNLKGGYVEGARVIEPPQLPDWALPAERGDPDEALQNLFKKARLNENMNTFDLENLYSKVSVMGNYDFSAPLIVKREVYEKLLALMNGKENQ